MVFLVSIGEEKKPAQVLVLQATENPNGPFCLIKGGNRLQGTSKHSKNA